MFGHRGSVCADGMRRVDCGPRMSAYRCPAAVPSCAAENLAAPFGVRIALTVDAFACVTEEHAPVSLMSGFDRLMREINVYLQCVDIVRGLA